MAVYKCEECAGSLELLENGLGKCQYCGALQTLPKDKSDEITQILNRANDFRMSCDFDRAIFEYEKALELDETEPEAHWGIFLSRYGVEYVKDTMSLAYKPTLHRISSTSVFDDVDYQATLKYASFIAVEQYKEKAALIESVMKELLLFSANQEPYDIFLSYKELDDVTRQRTDDSYLAHDLYNVLTAEGYKVFFAPKSLVGVLQYEPKIYSAIISAKVMIVLGTKPQYLEGVWVKNEWSRFAEAIEHGEEKVLIPVFKNMQAGELPNRIAKYQAYDMTSMTFIEDVKKVISLAVQKQSNVNFDKNASAEDAYLERGYLALEDKNFSQAEAFFENVLNLNPHNSQAYFGKLMVEMRISKQAQILTVPKYLKEYANFEKAVRFADQQQKTILLQYEEKVKQNLDEQKAREKAKKLDSLKKAVDDAIVSDKQLIKDVNLRLVDARQRYDKAQYDLEKAVRNRELIEEKQKKYENKQEITEFLPYLGVIGFVIFGILGLIDGAEFFLVLIVCLLCGAVTFGVLTVVGMAISALIPGKNLGRELNDAKEKEHKIRDIVDDLEITTSWLDSELVCCRKRYDYEEKNKEFIIETLITRGNNDVATFVSEQLALENQQRD